MDAVDVSVCKHRIAPRGSSTMGAFVQVIGGNRTSPKIAPIDGVITRHDDLNGLDHIRPATGGAIQSVFAVPTQTRPEADAGPAAVKKIAGARDLILTTPLEAVGGAPRDRANI